MRVHPPDTFASSAGLREEAEAMRARMGGLEEALRVFVAQVDEFHAGNWDEKDWPAALAALIEHAEVARAALHLGGGR